MNEQDLFEIMDGLPARQIAEAAEWKYRRGKDSGNEIDTILMSSTMPEKITYRDTKPETIDIADEPVSLHRQPGTEKQPRVIRSATAGLAAVAAVFALIFGGIALKLHRDNTEIEASLPGTAITDISVTEVTGTDLAALTVAPTGDFTTIVTTTELRSFTPVEKPIPQLTDESVSAGEENFLGGHGLLRPVSGGNGFPTIIQDDEYIYLENGHRIRKSEIDALNAPESEIICQKLGCPHDSDDCRMYKYGRGQLLCNGQDIFYIDWTMDSVSMGLAGGLQRILSDGTTICLHPQKKNPEALRNNGNPIGILYYFNVMPLGDTGIYFISTFDYESGEQPKLLNTQTGETIPLNVSRNPNSLMAEYDEQSGHVFVSGTNSGGHYEIISECDIYTGECLQTFDASELDTAVLTWFVRDHQLHLLGRSANKGYQVDWYSCNMDTHETTVILEDCKLETFSYCDGRVYAVRHASIGNDTVLSFAPDGTDETVLAEVANVVRDMSPVSDPGCIWLYTNSGTEYLLMNGRICRLQ